MSNTEQQLILIRAKADELDAVPGVLHIMRYDKRDRVLRAGKMLALYWGLALLSVPILVAHWVLVPAFFLAGPVMAYVRYRVLSRNTHVTGSCPVNKHGITMRLEPNEALPLWKYCPVCQAPLQLIQAPPS